MLALWAILGLLTGIVEPEGRLQIAQRAGLEFAQPAGQYVLAVKGPRIARGTYGLILEIRF